MTDLHFMIDINWHKRYNFVKMNINIKNIINKPDESARFRKAVTERMKLHDEIHGNCQEGRRAGTHRTAGGMPPGDGNRGQGRTGGICGGQLHYPQKIRAGLHFLRGVPGRGHVQGAQRLPRLREKPGQTVCRRLKNP